MARTFPLPFQSLRTIRGAGDRAFIVGAMFTAAYAEQAERLAASCEKFGLPYELHEVPTVHSSISMRGTDDPTFTKANFVHHLLTTHNKAVLYLDADCEFSAQPELITELVQSGCDFAIFNWFAEEYTDMFKPAEILAEDSTVIKDRYFRFAGSVDWYTRDQLMCSGLTQFYRNSRAARSLLRRWYNTIMDFPGCADDQCLDFAYNNLGKWRCWFLKTRWLPKAYARMGFWIYVSPVINHPEYPTKNDRFLRIKDPSGRRKQFYWPRIPKLQVNPLIPRDRIVDVKDGLLCKVVDGQVVPAERIEQEFWLG